MLRNAIPELDYLTQICFELFESADTQTTQKKYSVRLSISSGCHCSDPLDIHLDSKHCISCIPRRSLTSHLDMDEVSRMFRDNFSRVCLPKRFIPVNISSKPVSPIENSPASTSDMKTLLPEEVSKSLAKVDADMETSSEEGVKLDV
jgi:inositol hexakisphosphate/diphosphoinositol-pentakisphosphate kinase